MVDFKIGLYEVDLLYWECSRTMQTREVESLHLKLANRSGNSSSVAFSRQSPMGQHMIFEIACKSKITDILFC